MEPALRQRQIVAFGGGGFSMESGNPLLDDYVLGLCDSERPRVCFLPSASGDADHYIVRFYRAFPAERCEASHISLFRREQGPEDLREHLLSQDLIYVGGGSVISLLGVWRAHGIDVDPARSVGSRRHPLRALRRLALLVLGGGDRLPRRSAAARGPRPAALQQLRPLRARQRTPPRLPPLPARRDATAATPPRTAPPCTSAARTESCRRLPAGGPGLPARRRWESEWSRCGSPPPTSGTRAPAPRRPVPEAISTAAAAA